MARLLSRAHMALTVAIICLFSCSAAVNVPQSWTDLVNKGAMLVATGTEPSASMQPSVGNGYLASTIDEPCFFIGGVYNGPAGVQNPSHRACIPNILPVVRNAAAMFQYSGLNMREATYSRVYQVNSNCQVTQTIFAHRLLRHLLASSITIDNSRGATYCNLNVDLPSFNSTDFSILSTLTANGVTTRTIQTLVPELPNGPQTVVGITYNSMSVIPPTPPGSVAIYPYFVTAYTDMESSSPAPDSQALYNETINSYGTLFSSHRKAWSSLWASRVEIGGNLALAQVINSSLYYILSSIRSDWPWSLSPGGLASNGYNGHVFWDSETWMYPALLPLWPSIADGGVLQYRLNKLPGAKAKAKSYNKGWKGAMYPWESAFSGTEVTPTWADTGILEQHITGDVSFAMRQFYYATQSLNWLVQYYPAISAMADFWASRVKLRGSQYVIDNVIPPDEYQVGVNNSVYTNYVAAISLEWATEAAKIVGATPNANWMKIANAIKIPYDPVLNIHPEFDGYKGQTIKQADVVLLGYPLEMPMNVTTRQSDLAYYESRTDSEGPAMTWAMHAVGWLELNQPERAAAMFARGYANSHMPFGVWTETPTGGTVNFLTGAGGFIQSVINGYGGLRIKSKSFTWQPTIPPNSSSLAFRNVGFAGATLDVVCDYKNVVVTVTAYSCCFGILVQYNGASVYPALGIPLTIPYGTPFAFVVSN